MTGTIANVAFILFGGLFFQITKRELSQENQQVSRIIIIGLVLYTGFTMLWAGLSGGFWHGLGQLALVSFSMTLGRIIGALLRIQIGFNHIARFAKAQLTPASESNSESKSGFLVASGLFCVTPLAIIGGIAEGANGIVYPLIIKGMMDCIATMSFTRTFGPSVILSVVPVLALQGSLTLATRSVFLSIGNAQGSAALSATAGCLIFSVILIATGTPRIRLGDYLPSLIIAPVLAQIWW